MKQLGLKQVLATITYLPFFLSDLMYFDYQQGMGFFLPTD